MQTHRTGNSAGSLCMSSVFKVPQHNASLFFRGGGPPRAFAKYCMFNAGSVDVGWLMRKCVARSRQKCFSMHIYGQYADHIDPAV